MACRSLVAENRMALESRINDYLEMGWNLVSVTVTPKHFSGHKLGAKISGDFKSVEYVAWLVKDDKSKIKKDKSKFIKYLYFHKDKNILSFEVPKNKEAIVSINGLKICSNCGYEIITNAKFCQNCGKKSV